MSSGDAGITSTDGSPSTDPKLISAGASTTFRSYQQYQERRNQRDDAEGDERHVAQQQHLEHLVRRVLQSGGNTVNLVAPGDLNWIACDTDTCGPQQMDQEGGTSESSPLTAGAAADVISAYRATHGGHSPSPALVK